MLLFYNDYEEDIKYVKDAVEAGIVTEERLNEAVTRILGLKAHLGLNQKCLIKTEEDLKNFGCEEYKDVAKQISHEAITLVKIINQMFSLLFLQDISVFYWFHKNQLTYYQSLVV